MSVNFSPTNWVDNSQPAITASQLNRMERGILDCANAYNKIPSVYKYKGTLQDVSNLPMDNNEVGDVYNILNSGDNYSWNGESWEFLNISINITPFTEDYILERGIKEVNGATWEYEKWNSGTYKCWCIKTYSIDLQDGGFTGFPFATDFPIEFVGTPNVQAMSTSQLGANHIVSSVNWDNTSIINLRVYSTTATTVSGNMFFQVVGRWK